MHVVASRDPPSPDSDYCGVESDIGPPQTEQLGPSQACRRCDDVTGMQPISVGRTEKGAQLVPGPRLHVYATRFRPAGLRKPPCGVARGEAGVDGMLERGVEHRVRVLDRALRDPAACAVAPSGLSKRRVERSHVTRRELMQARVAEVGNESVLNDVAIAPERRGLPRCLLQRKPLASQ